MKPRAHVIDIPTIFEIESGSRLRIGKLLQREHFHKVAVFYDEQIKKMYGAEIDKVLEESNIEYTTLLLDSLDYCLITQNAFTLPSDLDAIIAIGGGKTIDGAKYMAFLKKIPFISVPTSTSNDGFSSPVASLIIRGKRTTAPAQSPYGIIVDLDIIASAPVKFIFSGIGDLMSKITALWDWKYEQEHIKIPYDDFAVMISQKAVNSFVHLNDYSFSSKEFLSEFIYSLCMNGIAMEISGSSAPASGSEHLISHAMDQLSEISYLHGTQVGIATYLVSIVQNNQTQIINDVFNKIGFWDHVQTLAIPFKLVEEAISLAPSIKPQRFTILHDQKKRAETIEILRKDVVLNRVLAK